jgi:hypothetical protein
MYGACSTYWKRRGAYRVLAWKTERKRPLIRPLHRWGGGGDNIKMDLQEVGCGYGLDGSGSGKGRVAVTCKCGNEPSSSIKCGEFLD